MAKGSSNAQSTYGSSMNGAGMTQGNAQSAWNGMAPTLLSQASNPTGMTTQQLANENTANNQSTGGSMATAVGRGNLEAGRTHNAGGFGAAIDEAARTAGRTQAAGALNIQNENAKMAQQKQQGALSELGSLYGTNVNGMGEMLKNANQATSNLTTADQDTTGDIMKGAQMATSMVGM